MRQFLGHFHQPGGLWNPCALTWQHVLQTWTRPKDWFSCHSCFYHQRLGVAVSWGPFCLGDLAKVRCTRSTGGDGNGSGPSQMSPLNRADVNRDPIHCTLGASQILRGRASIPCAGRTREYGSRPPKVRNLIAWSKPISVPFPLTLVISSELFLNLVTWVFSSFLAEVHCFPL